MKVKSIRKGVLAVTVLAWLAVGCELIVDFDRTKIPVEVPETGPVSDSAPEAAEDTGTDALPDEDADAGDGEAGEAGDADAEAG
jgi:hypothetical protein